MIDSQPELFAEPKRSASKILAGVAALVITALVFAGYAVLRKRHAQESRSLALSSPSTPAAEPRKPPVALVMVDEALLQGSKTIIGGTVKNTSTEKLEGLLVELELKRRKDGTAEKQILALDPAHLEPEQEGRYSLELKAQDYGSARLVALKAGPSMVSLPYATAQGQRRPAERFEPKTVKIEKRPSKPGGFLNTPDNPARVP